jgi:hypothetical protein
MSNPQQIINQLDSCIKSLTLGNTNLKTLGLKKAQTEKDYRVKKAQEILILKSEKYPVTLIMELVKGNESVAELRLQRDIAQSSYFVALDAINNLRSEIEILRSKLAWEKAELLNS